MAVKSLEECRRAEAEADKSLGLLQEEAVELILSNEEVADKQREILLASNRLQECQQANAEADRLARRLKEEEVGLIVQRQDCQRRKPPPPPQPIQKSGTHAQQPSQNSDKKAQPIQNGGKRVPSIQNRGKPPLTQKKRIIASSGHGDTAPVKAAGVHSPWNA